MVSAAGNSQAKAKNDKQVSRVADSGLGEGIRGWKVLGARFEIPDKYEIIDAVGSGAYGVVVAAKDTSIED